MYDSSNKFILESDHETRSTAWASVEVMGQGWQGNARGSPYQVVKRSWTSETTRDGLTR